MHRLTKIVQGDPEVLLLDVIEASPGAPARAWETRVTAEWELPHDFSIYGGVGYQFFEDPDAFEQFAWTAGISKSWKAVTFDLRYWGSDLNDDECLARSGFATLSTGRLFSDASPVAAARSAIAA